jgi:hypothetical protein
MCGENPRDVRRKDGAPPFVLSSVCSSCQSKVEEPTERQVAPVNTIWVDPATFVRLSPEEIAYRKWSEEDQKQHFGLPAHLMHAAREKLDVEPDRQTPHEKRTAARLAPAARDFVEQGGWSSVEPRSDRWRDGGLVAHRGVLHPEEHVDGLELRRLACEELGFTYEQISSVYRSGRKSADQRELRGRIDARLLALSREGGNMTALADALGLYRRLLEDALRRARAEA